MEDTLVILNRKDLFAYLNEYCEMRKREEQERDEKEFLSQEEAEKLLHKSSTTLWRYVQKGYLEAPQKRLGKNYYKTKQVMALL